MTITHVDRDHLAELTLRCATLEAELVAVRTAHAEAERQLVKVTEQLTAKSFEVERLRTESEYRLLRLQRGEVRTGERRESADAGLIYGPRCGKDRRLS